jgi:hypothetical protein
MNRGFGYVMSETKRVESEMVSVDIRDETRSLPKRRSLVSTHDGVIGRVGGVFPCVPHEYTLIYNQMVILYLQQLWGQTSCKGTIRGQNGW